MTNNKIDIKFHNFSEIKINTRHTSFNEEIYIPNLLEKDNNLNVLEILKSFSAIKKK